MKELNVDQMLLVVGGSDCGTAGTISLVFGIIGTAAGLAAFLVAPPVGALVLASQGAVFGAAGTAVGIAAAANGCNS